MAVMRKYERDIDIMLAEEFNVCPAFADWFLSKSRFSPRSGRVEEVFVSKSDNNGESDLIVVYKLENNNRVALLIEDKVDASIQPNQAERYKKRAEAEVSDGAFAEYDLFLCAPRAYCAAKPESSLFDRFISYEDIAAKLEEIDESLRGKYRASFIRDAALRPTSNWTREQDAATDAFWDEVYRMATRDFPALEMKPRRVTKNNSWIQFRPYSMLGKDKKVYIEVKAPRGLVALTFEATESERIRTKVERLLPSGMFIRSWVSLVVY